MEDAVERLDSEAHESLSSEADPLGEAFRLLVESVKEYAIFMLDPAGRVATWNQGAERIKGYRAEQIIGRHFSAFYRDEDRLRRHPERELAIARETGQYAEEGWRVRRDGSLFWASVVLTAVHDEKGRLIGFGKVTRDLTGRKRQEERERELMAERTARAEAEAANAAKSQFLATMSHELRTPLNAIMGYVDLLDAGMQGPLSPSQRTSVERIRRSSQYLHSLINDVLNFTRLDAGRIELRPEEVPVGTVLADVESLVLPQFREKGVDLLRGDGDPGLTVWADPERLQQILLNLVTNACKFTDPGGRTWLEWSGDEERVRIDVRDTGPGIPKERHEAVFEPFVQIARDLVARARDGVGLGLAISRELARAMAGELTVESRPGEGSTFRLTLPRSAGIAEPLAENDEDGGAVARAGTTAT